MRLHTLEWALVVISMLAIANFLTIHYTKVPLLDPPKAQVEEEEQPIVDDGELIYLRAKLKQSESEIECFKYRLNYYRQLEDNPESRLFPCVMDRGNMRIIEYYERDRNNGR